MKATRSITTRRAHGIVRAFLALAAMALLVSWNLLPSVQASAGELDPAFGTGGKASTHFYDYDLAYALAVQPDDRIVVVGIASRAPSSTGSDFGLARYNSNGELDATFGAGGKVTTDFSGYIEDEAKDVAIQPDGRIAVAGTVWESRMVPAKSDFALARYNTDGSLDPSFGSGGKVITDFFDGVEVARAVAIQSDGKIVVTAQASAPSIFILARYNADGSPDTTFGSNGRVTSDVFSGSDIAIQPDGKIVAAGGTVGGESGSDLAVARFNPDGSADMSFGTAGIAKYDSTDGAAASAITLQPDGSIVTAGSTSNVNPVLRDFALTRFNSNGSIDSSFGSNGEVTTDFGQSSDHAYTVTVQPDGKIIAAGSAVIGDYNIALARYNSDGSLDSSFGSGGKVVSDLFGHDEEAYGVALRSDGRILTAGYSEVGISTGSDFVLACYQNSLAAAPLITGAEVIGKKLYIYGASFDDGAKIYLDGDKQKTANDETNPTTTLIGKKAGKKIARGETVILQVKNPDGTLSNEFMFTRPDQ